MRAPRDDASDRIGMTLMGCPVQIRQPTTGCAREADQRDIGLGERNSKTWPPKSGVEAEGIGEFAGIALCVNVVSELSVTQLRPDRVPTGPMEADMYPTDALGAAVTGFCAENLDLVRFFILDSAQQQCGGCLLVSYNSQLLQEVCFQSSAAIKYLGEEAATTLHARHADLQAADNVFDLLVGQVSVEGNHCTLTVKDVLSIVMSPNYAAAANGNAYDWSTVGRIKLMGINDVN